MAGNRLDFVWQCPRRFFSNEEQVLVDCHRRFMDDLENGRIGPTTDAQRRFLNVLAGMCDPQTEYELVWVKYKQECTIHRLRTNKAHVEAFRRYAAKKRARNTRTERIPFHFRCPKTSLPTDEAEFLEEFGGRIQQLVRKQAEPIESWEFEMLKNLQSNALDCKASLIWKNYERAVLQRGRRSKAMPESKPKYKNIGDDRAAWKRMRHGGYGDFKKRQWDF